MNIETDKIETKESNIGTHEGNNEKGDWDR